MDFPTGVELHNGKIRITFTYRGQTLPRSPSRLDGEQQQHQKLEIFVRS